jgi:hypothetical protein
MLVFPILGGLLWLFSRFYPGRAVMEQREARRVQVV